MMRYKVIFYPLYEETLVVTNLTFDNLPEGVDYVHHYTLKTPRAQKWSESSRLRELADRLDAEESF